MFHRPEVKPNARNAQLVRQFHAVDGMLDIFLPNFWIGIHKVLMNRKSDEIHAVEECSTLEALKVGRRLVRHLPMQNVHALHIQLGGVVNNLLDRILFRLEVPNTSKSKSLT